MRGLKWSNALNKPWFILVDGEITMMGDDVPDKEELVEIINDAYEKCTRNARRITSLKAQLAAKETENAQLKKENEALKEDCTKHKKKAQYLTDVNFEEWSADICRRLGVEKHQGGHMGDIFAALEIATRKAVGTIEALKEENFRVTELGKQLSKKIDGLDGVINHLRKGSDDWMRKYISTSERIDGLINAISVGFYGVSITLEDALIEAELMQKIDFNLTVGISSGNIEKMSREELIGVLKKCRSAKSDYLPALSMIARHFNDFFWREVVSRRERKEGER